VEPALVVICGDGRLKSLRIQIDDELGGDAFLYTPPGGPAAFLSEATRSTALQSVLDYFDVRPFNLIILAMQQDCGKLGNLNDVPALYKIGDQSAEYVWRYLANRRGAQVPVQVRVYDQLVDESSGNKLFPLRERPEGTGDAYTVLDIPVTLTN
jgi:hypothetical protein